MHRPEIGNDYANFHAITCAISRCAMLFARFSFLLSYVLSLYHFEKPYSRVCSCTIYKRLALVKGILTANSFYLLKSSSFPTNYFTCPGFGMNNFALIKDQSETSLVYAKMSGEIFDRPANSHR